MRNRSIQGKLYRAASQSEIATIQGTNLYPGIIELNLIGDSIEKFPRSIKYRRFQEDGSAATRWMADVGPLSEMVLCDDELCPEKKFDGFDILAGWETNQFEQGLGYIEKATNLSEAKKAKNILSKYFPSKLEILGDYSDETKQKLKSVRIIVPSGLEDEAASMLEKKGIGGFSRASYMRGSEIFSATFPPKTFLSSETSIESIDTRVGEARAKILAEFKEIGFDVSITQSKSGGLSFVLTCVGHGSKRLNNGKLILSQIPDVWLKTTIQVRLGSRHEQIAPGERVDILEAHIIDSRIYKGPSATLPPTAANWQTFESFSSSLDSTAIDNNLIFVILDALAMKLNGTVRNLS